MGWSTGRKTHGRGDEERFHISRVPRPPQPEQRSREGIFSVRGKKVKQALASPKTHTPGWPWRPGSGPLLVPRLHLLPRFQSGPMTGSLQDSRPQTQPNTSPRPPKCQPGPTRPGTRPVPTAPDSSSAQYQIPPVDPESRPTLLPSPPLCPRVEIARAPGQPLRPWAPVAQVHLCLGRFQHKAGSLGPMNSGLRITPTDPQAKFNPSGPGTGWHLQTQDHAHPCWPGHPHGLWL